jgi:hypothetical protein
MNDKIYFICFYENGDGYVYDKLINNVRECVCVCVYVCVCVCVGVCVCEGVSISFSIHSPNWRVVKEFSLAKAENN